ncbi:MULTISPECIES: hypothetical protein [Sphingobacterium]|uniref:hypothetical protein n=1 Tax=Sphingobacterium TaxID=28453 RepID=UPI0013DA1956|nr:MULTISPECIES: hypothetical protein [unclassified Sphingobacterium]
MKGKVIVSSFLTHLFSAGRASAVTIFPFIFVKTKKLGEDMVLINHEQIHIKQALELLVLPFYILYLLEFLIQLVHCRDFHRAYRNISFEREAYFNEGDLDYRKNRKVWSFTKYYR